MSRPSLYIRYLLDDECLLQLGLLPADEAPDGLAVLAPEVDAVTYVRYHEDHWEPEEHCNEERVDLLMHRVGDLRAVGRQDVQVVGTGRQPFVIAPFGGVVLAHDGRPVVVRMRVHVRLRVDGDVDRRRCGDVDPVLVLHVEGVAGGELVAIV
jgi:hypothetical protein